MSGVGIGGVAMVDAVLKAEIENINGLTIPAAVAPPLDTYTNAASSYSVRLLRTAYTGDCMRVRRDSDNTEQDIGFDGNGNLDTAAIATFVGSGNNGYIRYWYDQSGNAVDSGQSTAGSQPKIYSGTAVLEDNGKPAVLFDGTNDYLDKSTTDSVTDFVSLFTVGASDSLTGSIPGAGRCLASLGTTTTNGQRRANILWNGGSGTTWYYYTSVYGANNQIATATVDTQYLHSSIFDTVGNDNQGAIDGGTLVNFNGTLNTMSNYTIRLGTSSADEYWSGYVQEVIAYKANQTINRTGIETNIDDYYEIPGM